MHLPEKFESLRPYVGWALATPNARQRKRLASSSEELKSFYDAMLPHLEEIIEACNEYKLGELPPELHPIYNMALSLAEVAHHIELYRGQVGVPYAFEESRFVAVHGEDATWQAKAPSGIGK